MKNFSLILLALAFGGSLQAQTLDLSGKVSDVNGVPLVGAKVELVRIGMNTTTSSDGSFSFSGMVGIGKRLGNIQAVPVLASGILNLSLSQSQRVVVSLHDLKGKQVWMNKLDLAVGEHAISLLPQSGVAINFVKVSIGEESYQFRTLNLATSLISGHGRQTSRIGLAKAAADADTAYIDSMKVSYDGYITRSIPVRDTGKHTVYLSLPDLTLPAAEVERIRAKFENALGARYMEKNCVPTTYPNWDGFPLIMCSYSMRDASGVVKPAKVIMLNAEPLQLARWTVAASQLIKGNTNTANTNAIFTQIYGESGAQFALAGVVYEDMEGNGVNKIYCFRDGVTAYPIGMPALNITRAMTAKEIEISLYGELDPSTTGQYARVQSTSREEYKANGGKIDVGSASNRKLAWLDVIREQYKAAWGHDRNALLLAWVKSNL